MKKVLSIIASIMCLSAFVWAVTSSTVVEHKQYGSTMPGQMYFVLYTNNAAVSSVTITNNETEMWYPSKFEIIYPDGSAPTTAVYKVTQIATWYYATNTVATNDIGIVTTNYNQGVLTNTVYEYVTNILCTITNASGYGTTFTDQLSDDYMKKGDSLYITLSSTNSSWIKIIGYR